MQNSCCRLCQKGCHFVVHFLLLKESVKYLRLDYLSIEATLRPETEQK